MKRHRSEYPEDLQSLGEVLGLWDAEGFLLPFFDTTTSHFDISGLFDLEPRPWPPPNSSRVSL